MSVFNVKVKWNKEMYTVDLDTTEPPAVFKAQIFALTGVSTERQKVMFKGAVIKDEEWNPATIKAVKDGVTFLVIGSADELPAAPQEKVLFMEDMNENELAAKMNTPAGLINLGNTCYLNATVQCLYSVPELRECLRKYSGSLQLNDSFDGAHDIVVSLRDVYDKMDQTQTVIPVMLLEMLHLMFPQFAEKTENGLFAQQDANECWSELLKVLQQKLNIEIGTDKKNFISQYFGGKFDSTMKCVENADEEVAVSTENFLQLSCFISQDVKYLQTGLKLRLEEEITKFSKTLNRDAQYIKTSRIARLPAYVSISLVRFFYKEKNSINAKILKDVKFSMNLDLYELCTPELQKKLLPMRQKFKEYEDKVAEKASKGGEKAEEPKEYYDYFFEDDQGSNNSGMYQLNGVLTHKGRSSSSGHYVAWIKNKGDWHCAYVLLYGPQMVPKIE